MAAIPKVTGPGAVVPGPPDAPAASIRAISVLSRAMVSLLVSPVGGMGVMAMLSSLMAASRRTLVFAGPRGQRGREPPRL